MNNTLSIVLAVIAALGLMWMMGTPSEEKPQPDRNLERFAAQQACLAELNQAIKEIDRRLQHAIALNDQRAIQAYSPMAYRLAEIRRRMENTKGLFGNYDATDDLAEIREIKAKLGR
jgi:hypothetical protein